MACLVNLCWTSVMCVGAAPYQWCDWPAATLPWRRALMQKSIISIMTYHSFLCNSFCVLILYTAVTVSWFNNGKSVFTVVVETITRKPCCRRETVRWCYKFQPIAYTVCRQLFVSFNTFNGSLHGRRDNE